MIRLVIFQALLFILVINTNAQEKKTFHLELTKLSEQLLDMFINDSMNSGRINPNECSIVLSFGDKFEEDIELRITDGELLYSCVAHTYITNFKNYSIFYQREINSKYLRKVISNHPSNCLRCESLLKINHVTIDDIFMEYDGSSYKVKKGTTPTDIIIEKVIGG